ncbi:MAG: hypothetical protein RQ723_08590 [Desulfuromonadales bacterium]|nr:hypothetical protein [Desulfuromonadales bacterium]
MSILLAKYANYDPRSAITCRNDVARYEYILLGDSAFCSYYVDAEGETLWRRLEAGTGKRVFPGALNAADSLDFLDQAYYVSLAARPGSTVLLNLIPTRDFGEKERSHEKTFDLLLGNNRWALAGTFLGEPYAVANIYKYRYLYGLYDSTAIKNFPEIFSRSKSYFKTRRYFDRTWNDGSPFARERYDKFLEVMNVGKIYDVVDYTGLEKIRKVLSSNNIRTIFVISPVNHELIEQWSGDRLQDMQAFFETRTTKLKNYLSLNNFEYIDLSRSVDSSGFADLTHTNAAGEMIVAGEIVKYINGRNMKASSGQQVQ